MAPLFKGWEGDHQNLEFCLNMRKYSANQKLNNLDVILTCLYYKYKISILNFDCCPCVSDRQWRKLSG